MQNIFYLSTFTLLFYYITFITCQQVSARKNAGCALISNKIFCYGGYPVGRYGSLNVQHIGLDLTQLRDISNLDDSKIQWNMVTDIINSTQRTVRSRSYQGLAVATSNNSYIMFGGVHNHSIIDTELLLNYNPQTYTWKSLQADSNINATSSNTIVNMGDDIFWLWGGESYENRTLPNIAQIYDYKAGKWVNQIIENNVLMRNDHTATLGLNGFIYVLGGSTKGSDGNYSASNFNEVRMFDTKSSQWSYFNATGHTVSSRISHTATQLPNRNQIFIYGGIHYNPDNSTLYTPPMDYCIIFDYSKNTFQNIEFPNPPNSVNIRYGHFADIYIETYLVMAFGFIDENTPATSLSVLDITDPYQPRWATSFSNFPTNSTDTINEFRREYIVAIVVPLLLTVIVLFIYIHKKRKGVYNLPKEPLVIDKSDPRLNIKETNFNGVNYGNLIIGHKDEGFNKIHGDSSSDIYCKPFENTKVEYIKPTIEN